MSRDDSNPKLKQLLVVEDSSSDANLVQLMLEADGNCRVQVVDSLKEAARAVRDQPPNVILLDLHLPDADGLEAVDAAIEFARDAPIVVLTGSDDETLAIEAVKRGAQDYLSKNDANPKLLNRVVRHAEERQRLVRELREARERLEQQSRSDPLTGLLNRRGLERQLERECRWARRAGQTLHVLAWDLDDFKSVNDREGHAAGDELLIGIAACAKKAFRDTDLIARIGGDEFMAVLRGVRSAEAFCIAERLCESVARTGLKLKGGTVGVTISVGLVEVHPHRTSIGELLRAVDDALYRSKKSGKNRVSHTTIDGASSSTQPEEVRSLYFAAEPILEPLSGDPVAYELLVRSDDPGFSGAPDLFAMARRSGRLTGRDLEVLGRAVRASSALEPSKACHVNLFPSTLRELGPEAVGSVLGACPERRFCIDLSEQQLVGDASTLRDPLRALRTMGYSVALDHIGSCRSSLETLLAIDPDVVKLDNRWTRKLEDTPRQRRELRKMLGILAGSGSTVVVARPETQDGRELLLEIADKAGIEFFWSNREASSCLREPETESEAHLAETGAPS